MSGFAWIRSLLALVVVGAVALRRASAAPAPDLIWRLDNPKTVAGIPAEVLGAPRIEGPVDARCAVFNGHSDGLILPASPIAGWKAFTIEVLFRPDADGPKEQRFIHAQDETTRRLTFETRIFSGQWALDTYLADGASRRALLDVKLLHPCDRWYWAALRYDGQTMTSLVNGQKELAGPVTFAPMGAAHIGIGVRLNRIYWFKGAIRELRFYSTALADADLAGPP